MTNCPNCGAVVNDEYDKCAYCKTPYDKSKSTSKYFENSCDSDVLSAQTVLLNIGGKKMKFYVSEIEYECSSYSCPHIKLELVSIGDVVDE